MSTGKPNIISFQETPTEDNPPDKVHQTAVLEHHQKGNHSSASGPKGFIPSSQMQDQKVSKEDLEDEDEDEGGASLSPQIMGLQTGLAHHNVPNDPASPSPPGSSDQMNRSASPNENKALASTQNLEFQLSWNASSFVLHNEAVTPATRKPIVPVGVQGLTPMTASAGSSSMLVARPDSLQSLHTNYPTPPSVAHPQLYVAPPFRPNNMVLEKFGAIGASPPHDLPENNYVGKRHLPTNSREVVGLPDWENCCLFLTKIPVEVTLHEIFQVIKTGSVFCLHINPPGGMHRTKAAKLAFMNPEAAMAFLRETQSPRGVILGGSRIQGRYNRNGYARNLNVTQSRVLELLGPTPLMTLANWTTHFSNFSEFEIEAYRSYPSSRADLTVMEFRFARIDGQAQTCLQCIRSDPSLTGVVQVRYAADPCGPSVVAS